MCNDGFSESLFLSSRVWLFRSACFFLAGPVVSLNRFERKKNLPLAVEALAWALDEMGAEEASRKGLRLVVAGERLATHCLSPSSFENPNLLCCDFFNLFVLGPGVVVSNEARGSLLRVRGSHSFSMFVDVRTTAVLQTKLLSVFGLGVSVPWGFCPPGLCSNEARGSSLRVSGCRCLSLSSSTFERLCFRAKPLAVCALPCCCCAR